MAAEGKELKYNNFIIMYDTTSSYESTDKQLASLAVNNGMQYNSGAETRRMAIQETIQDIGIYGMLFAVILVVYVTLQHSFLNSRMKFLSVCEDEESVVKGLNIGGDDYVVKPYRTKELLSRIRANLRKSQSHKVENVLKSKDLVVDRKQGIVKKQYEVLGIVLWERYIEIFMKNKENRQKKIYTYVLMLSLTCLMLGMVFLYNHVVGKVLRFQKNIIGVLQEQDEAHVQTYLQAMFETINDSTIEKGETVLQQHGYTDAENENRISVQGKRQTKRISNARRIHFQAKQANPKLYRKYCASGEDTIKQSV